MENWAYFIDFFIVKLQYCQWDLDMLSVGCPVEILMWYNFMRKENEPFCDFCHLLWAENKNISLVGFEGSVLWYCCKKPLNIPMWRQITMRHDARRVIHVGLGGRFLPSERTQLCSEQHAAVGGAVCVRRCVKTKVSQLQQNSMALFMALGVNSVNWPNVYLNNYTLPSAEHVPGSLNWKIFFCLIWLSGGFLKDSCKNWL